MFIATMDKFFLLPSDFIGFLTVRSVLVVPFGRPEGGLCPSLCIILIIGLRHRHCMAIFNVRKKIGSPSKFFLDVR